MPDTRFLTSPDGSQIAYDLAGAGSTILLLHGGGGSRQEWHAAGYVSRLQEHDTVVSMDLRGHGESARPSSATYYGIDKMMADTLAVADTCGQARFALWGMSFDGKVGRYPAALSPRVSHMVMMGTPMGPSVAGKLRQDTLDFCAHWQPLLSSPPAGRLDPAARTPEDIQSIRRLVDRYRSRPAGENRMG